MIKPNKIFAALGILFLHFYAIGQDSVAVLSLQKAIDLGVANSKQLKASAEKINVAIAKLGESNTQQLPQINLSSNYTRVSDNVTPLSVKFPGAPQPLVLNPQVLNQFAENIGGSGLIYSGGRVKKTSKSLEFLVNASKLDYENDKSSAILNIITAYYNLYSLQQSQKILAANETLLKARLNDLQNLEINGIVLPNDVLKLAISLSQLNVQQLNVRNSYEATRYGIAILLGLPDSIKIELDTRDFFTYKLEKPYADYENTALRTRPDLGSANNRLIASLYSIDAARANYYPTISAAANYNYLKPNPRWLPERNQFDGTWNAGITLAWNISSLITNKHYMGEERGNYNQNYQQKLATADNIKIELYTNYLAYQNAIGHLALTQKTLDQASENYRIVNEQLQNNVVLPADLQDAINNLIQSQLNVLIDKAAIDLAYFKFIKSTGTLTK